MLQVDDRVKLQEVIVGLPEFAQGALAARQNLLWLAGLDHLSPGIDLAGSSQMAGAQMIRVVDSHGPLQNRRGYHALGALLAYLLTREDLPGKDATFLASLIVKYGLVAETAYVRELRERYDLDAIEVVKPRMESGKELTVSRPSGDLYDRRFLIALRKVLDDRFDEQELRMLCHGLGVDYENLGGRGRTGKVLDLVEYARRHRLVADLLQVGRELRSDVPWEDIGVAD